MFINAKHARGVVWNNGVRDVVICIEGELSNRGKFPQHCIDTLTNIAVCASELGQLVPRNQTREIEQCPFPFYSIGDLTTLDGLSN